MSVWNKIYRGLLAGLIGGIAGIAIFWGAWLLPVLGLLLTRVNLMNGIFVMLLLGAVGGILYSLIKAKRTKQNIFTSLLEGIVLGFIFWVIGVLILVPVILGFPPLITSPQDHIVSLIAFILYGIITVLSYSIIAFKKTDHRLYYLSALLIVSLISTPLMLRLATNTEPNTLELPPEYKAEVVAKGFTYPTSIAVDSDNRIYVAESGYSYGPKTTVARVLMVDNGRVSEIARGFDGPINGLAIKNDTLYVSHRGKITEYNLKSKNRRDLITELPSLGDHQNNDLLFGKDGDLYFGQGTATNAGVVGHDNFVYGWADKYPKFHDFPSRDFVLQGENYRPLNLGSVNPVDTKITGAYSPYGAATSKGQQVKESFPANGVIHRYNLRTGQLSIYCDGLRNPYGLAMAHDGTMYASNLGYDDRGVRAVKGSPDWIVKLKEGAWYGWPDYAGLTPLTENKFKSKRGVNLNPLIMDPPAVEPPLTELDSHYSPMKLAFAPAGFHNDGLYVAIFGDGQPLTEDLDRQVPTGVLRINPSDGSYSWFVKNKQKLRAGRLGDGLRRIIDVKFDQDGESLFILDFGVLEFTDLAPNAIPNTGVLWKISLK